MPKSPQVPTKTVAFSLRHLRTDLRDRLHALAALVEAKTGERTTLEAMTNATLEQGLESLEPQWYGPASKKIKKE